MLRAATRLHHRVKGLHLDAHFRALRQRVLHGRLCHEDAWLLVCEGTLRTVLAIHHVIDLGLLRHVHSIGVFDHVESTLHASALLIETTTLVRVTHHHSRCRVLRLVPDPVPLGTFADLLLRYILRLIW